MSLSVALFKSNQFNLMESEVFCVSSADAKDGLSPPLLHRSLTIILRKPSQGA